MERLTNGDGISYWSVSGENCNKAFARLATIENILGDDYDLDRLRELLEAYRDGRCFAVPVKPGEKVRLKRRPCGNPEIVDCITIYTGGKITYGFHEIGMRTEWVDRWEEEDADMYNPDNPENTEER